MLRGLLVASKHCLDDSRDEEWKYTDYGIACLFTWFDIMNFVRMYEFDFKWIQDMQINMVENWDYVVDSFKEITTFTRAVILSEVTYGDKLKQFNRIHNGLFMKNQKVSEPEILDAFCDLVLDWYELTLSRDKSERMFEIQDIQNRHFYLYEMIEGRGNTKKCKAVQQMLEVILLKIVNNMAHIKPIQTNIFQVQLFCNSISQLCHLPIDPEVISMLDEMVTKCIHQLEHMTIGECLEFYPVLKDLGIHLHSKSPKGNSVIQVHNHIHSYLMANEKQVTPQVVYIYLRNYINEWRGPKSQVTTAYLQQILNFVDKYFDMMKNHT